MERATQRELIHVLLVLYDKRSLFLDEHWEKPGLDRYLSPEFFVCERDGSYLVLPQIAARASELPPRALF